jgi:hypothetical protein
LGGQYQRKIIGKAQEKVGQTNAQTIEMNELWTFVSEKKQRLCHNYSLPHNAQNRRLIGLFGQNR